MSNIIAAGIICYGLISISFAISFAPQYNNNSREEKVARAIAITFWPIAVLGAIGLMFVPLVLCLRPWTKKTSIDTNTDTNT